MGSSCNYFVLYDLAGRSLGCQRPRPSLQPLPRPPPRPHLPHPFRLLATNGRGHRRYLCHGLHNGLFCHILSVFWLPTAAALAATSATASTTASSATSFPSFGCQRPRPSPLPLPRPPPRPLLPRPFRLLAAKGIGHRRYLRRGLCRSLHYGLICHVLSVFWLPTASAIAATSGAASSDTSFSSFGCQRPRSSPLPLPRPLPRPFP
jgi:hypothetical protein